MASVTSSINRVFADRRAIEKHRKRQDQSGSNNQQRRVKKISDSVKLIARYQHHAGARIGSESIKKSEKRRRKREIGSIIKQAGVAWRSLAYQHSA